MQPLNMICLNMGFNVMSNKVAGSESDFVKLCQKEYPKYQGWTSSTKQISAATYNAARFLAEFDIFALQEVNEQYKHTLFDTIKYQNMNKNFHFLSSYYDKNKTASIVIGFDKDLTGPATEITHNMKLDSRAIQIVWFEKLQLLFINLHAPHNIDLKHIIESTCDKIKLSVNPSHIIMTGDFNDYKGNLLSKSINIFNEQLKIPNKKAVKTCCTDTNYKFPGDYFLISDNQYLYYGLPPKYDRKIDLFSDHDPIILVSNI